MANDENPTIKQYSNLEVHAQITQTESQGTNSNSVLKVGTYAPITIAGSTATGGTVPGQVVICNNGSGPSYIKTSDGFNLLGGLQTELLSTTQTESKYPLLISPVKNNSNGVVTGPITSADLNSDLYFQLTGSSGRLFAPSINTQSIYATDASYGSSRILSTFNSSNASMDIRVSNADQSVSPVISLATLNDGTVKIVPKTSCEYIFTEYGITLYASGAINSQSTAAVDGKTVYTALTNGTVTKVSGWNGSGNNTVAASVGGTLQPIYLSSNKLIAGTQLYNNKVTVDSTASTIVTTGTGTLTLASKTYVDNLLAASDAMVFKGTIGSSGATVTALPAVHEAGWTYKVITAGTYAGKTCEIGDLIIAVKDRTSGADTDDDWTVVQANIDGAITGTNDAVTSGTYPVAIFNGSNRVIKTSGYTIGKSVPSDAVFTDHLVDQNVATYSNNGWYPLLMTPTANASTNQSAKTTLFGANVKANPDQAQLLLVGENAQINVEHGTDTKFVHISPTQVTCRTGNVTLSAYTSSKAEIGHISNVGKAILMYSDDFSGGTLKLTNNLGRSGAIYSSSARGLTFSSAPDGGSYTDIGSATLEDPDDSGYSGYIAAQYLKGVHRGRSSTFNIPANNTNWYKILKITKEDYASHGYTAHIRFRVWGQRDSEPSKAQDFTVDVEWGGGRAYFVASTAYSADGSNAPIRYLATDVPAVPTSSSNTLDCSVSIKNGNTTAVTNMHIEVLEADIPYTVMTGTLSDITTSSSSLGGMSKEIAPSNPSYVGAGLGLVIGGSVSAEQYNGYALGNACAKTVDTSISAGSTSTNLPTTAAVVNYIGAFAKKAAYTISVQAAGAYVIPSSTSPASSPTTAIGFTPKLVQIYDPDGVQVVVRTEIDSTNNKVTFRTASALSSAQTWTVNIIGW